MLDREDIELQVKTFRQFARKPGNLEFPVRWLFHYWAISKDFSPEDWEAISLLINANLQITLSDGITNLRNGNQPMEIQHIPVDNLKQIDQTTEKEYLSLDELCQRIPYRPQTIRNRMSQGVLLEGVHYFKPTSRRVVFKWSAIQRWIECVDRRETNIIPLARGR